MKFQQYFHHSPTVVFAISMLIWTENSATQWYIFTKFEDVPELYLQLRLQNLDPHFRSKLSAEIKYELCWYIIRPSEGDLIPPEEYVEELQRATYRNIFNDLFHKSRFWRKYRHKNESKSRAFLIQGDEYDEMTFICLVRSHTTQQIIPYYVSDYEYNVNEVALGPIILGRFIFVNNQVYGLAEERPILRSMINSYSSFEMYYLKKRSGHSVANTFDADPVCKLDSGRKLRLCAYVCTEISAACSVSVAVEGCELKQFLVQNTSFYGWMLTCKMEDQEYRYVTRSYNNNQVFILKTDNDGKLKLYYNMIRVSLIVDATEK